jgi:hypothetical protein
MNDIPSKDVGLAMGPSKCLLDMQFTFAHSLGYPAVNLRSHALGIHAVDLCYAIYIMQKSSYVYKKSRT